MYLIAWWLHPQLGELYFLMNQWGKNAHGKCPSGAPNGGVWIRKDDVNWICRDEVFAFSQFANVQQRIDSWLELFASDNPSVAAIDRGTSDDSSWGEPRWYVRMHGEEKDFITVWLTLGQRTLRYETYVMPDPEENRSDVLDYLMRRNDALVGAHFSDLWLTRAIVWFVGLFVAA